jgi:flagellar protein FliO/FliZ
MKLRPAFTSAATAVFGMLLLAPAALAADGETTKLDFGSASGSTAKASAPQSGGGLVRTIIGLAVVIGVIYGLTWVLKQVKGNKEQKSSGQGLAPLAALPLGGNRSVQLIRVGTEIVLVGIGEAGVTPLRTYTIAEARSLGLPVDDAPVADTRATAQAAFAQSTPDGGPVQRVLGELRRRTVIK